VSRPLEAIEEMGFVKDRPERMVEPGGTLLDGVRVYLTPDGEKVLFVTHGDRYLLVCPHCEQARFVHFEQVDWLDPCCQEAAWRLAKRAGVA